MTIEHGGVTNTYNGEVRRESMVVVGDDEINGSKNQYHKVNVPKTKKTSYY
jgi:hypothetical protein